MHILLALLIIVLPIAVSAQEDVRAQIRADLMQDPRTAELSPAEREQLIDAIAGQVESTPEGNMYLDAQSAPTFVYDDPPVATASPYLTALSTPIVIAILALIAGILSLVIFMLRHKKGTPESDLQNS